MSIEKQERSRKGASGLVFVGCFMIALALGLLLGNLVPFVLAGIGLGFIGMAVTRAATGEW